MDKKEFFINSLDTLGMDIDPRTFDLCTNVCIHGCATSSLRRKYGTGYAELVIVKVNRAYTKLETINDQIKEAHRRERKREESESRAEDEDYRSDTLWYYISPTDSPDLRGTRARDFADYDRRVIEIARSYMEQDYRGLGDELESR